ncbi:hypothetical protein BJ741DRAFT_627192 [Chytriomyces cf. hyalinus JEL632]|nr:hypothetical protein BJ741DRAFT_627192 [Chytriomyces cf. hyalinus JEL632]
MAALTNNFSTMKLQSAPHSRTGSNLNLSGKRKMGDEMMDTDSVSSHSHMADMSRNTSATTATAPIHSMEHMKALSRVHSSEVLLREQPAQVPVTMQQSDVLSGALDAFVRSESLLSSKESCMHQNPAKLFYANALSSEHLVHWRIGFSRVVETELNLLLSDSLLSKVEIATLATLVHRSTLESNGSFLSSNVFNADHAQLVLTLLRFQHCIENNKSLMTLWDAGMAQVMALVAPTLVNGHGFIGDAGVLMQASRSVYHSVAVHLVSGYFAGFKMNGSSSEEVEGMDITSPVGQGLRHGRDMAQ